MYGIQQEHVSIDKIYCVTHWPHQLATKTPSGAARGLRETQPSTAKSSAGSSWVGENPKKVILEPDQCTRHMVYWMNTVELNQSIASKKTLESHNLSVRGSAG